LESNAIAALFLHNCIAVVLVLLLSILVRIRWLVSLIAWSLTIGASFLWKGIGNEWFLAWNKYIKKLVFDGGLWRDSTTEAEIIGLLLFWLLPLGLAYATALARITKIKD
jgi:hypothetical protein